jgi:hypothetical protein
MMTEGSDPIRASETPRQRCERFFAKASVSDRMKLRSVFDRFQERDGDFNLLTDHLVGAYLDRYMPSSNAKMLETQDKRERLVQRLEEAVDDLLKYERRTVYWFNVEKHADVLAKAIAEVRADPTLKGFSRNRPNRPKVSQRDRTLAILVGRDGARDIVAVFRRMIAAGAWSSPPKTRPQS